VYAASIQTFDDAYVELARKFRLPCSSPGSSKGDVRDGVRDWLEDNSDWLMVIDNADTYGDFFGDSNGGVDGAIRDALPLPRPASAMILYTSRHARIGAELTEHHRLQINNLSPEDSKSLLRTKLLNRISDESAVALLQALEYLPMSIAHAAAYLNFTKCPIQEYLRRVEHDADFLELLDSQHVNVGRRHAKAPLSVVKVLLTTLELLTLHNERAANLLYLMVCLDRQNIAVPTVILAIGERTARQRRSCAIELPESHTEFESAIAELESLALVTRRDDGQSFAVHRLVQATIIQRMSTRRVQIAYLLLCAHSLMESHFHGISALLARHDNARLISAQYIVPGHEKAHQSLAEYPKGFRVGLSLLCRLGVFSYARDKSAVASKRQLVWLRYICLLPMEAILTAAKHDLDVGGNKSPQKFQRLHTMANLSAQKSFGELERLSLRTIRESTSQSLPMVAAKFYLARAVANIRLVPNRSPITKRSVHDLIRDASKEADAMQLQQDESRNRYEYHNLLIDIYLEAGESAKAITLQERACEELASMFGPQDLDVLGYRVQLAELKWPHLVSIEELRRLEHELQAVYDRMHNPRQFSSADEKGELAAIDHMSRVKVLSCRTIHRDLSRQTTHNDTALSAAFKDAKRILQNSLIQLDRLRGPLSMQTTRKMYQYHGLLMDFGKQYEAGDFSLKRATFLLTEISGCKQLSDESCAIIEKNIKLFIEHDRARPLCAKILFTCMRHFKARQSDRTIGLSTPAKWFPLELLQAALVQPSELEPLVPATKRVQHPAVCDQCGQVRESR